MFNIALVAGFYSAQMKQVTTQKKKLSTVFVSQHCHWGILGSFSKKPLQDLSILGATVQANRVAIEDLGE